jgi:hypothetical protein
VKLRKQTLLLTLGIAVSMLTVQAKDRDSDKAKDNRKEPVGQRVDSGTFGIYMNGRRVATETFSIQQSPAGSNVVSEFKTEGTADQSVQSSELQLGPTGDLRKYEWRESSPDKATVVVTPNDTFLIEHYTMRAEDKSQDQPFLLPVSTSILDDYFFVHREVLAWKYLATGCRQNQGQVQCPQGQNTQFGTLNPHARSSMPISLVFVAKEKVSIRGVDRELNHLDLKCETGDWSLWLDDQFKLVRVLVPGDNTEVLRD